MASPSSPMPPTNGDHEGTTAPRPIPNWVELPQEVTEKILHKIGAIEIMRSAEQVCTLWRKICKDPLMWRTIHVHSFFDKADKDDTLCRRAIDRSCGHLQDIHLQGFSPSDDLLRYIANRISDDALIEVAKKLPLLEEFEISVSMNCYDSLEAIGRCCPRLTSLRFNRSISYSVDAYAIAQNMPKLKHLQLMGNTTLTENGLLAILRGCPLLESLDVRGCFRLCWNRALRKIFSRQIKDLRFPDDNIESFIESLWRCCPLVRLTSKAVMRRRD